MEDTSHVPRCTVQRAICATHADEASASGQNCPAESRHDSIGQHEIGQHEIGQHEIAFRTDLLCLNAALESAGSPDGGRLPQDSKSAKRNTL